jgi:hypothetical protein
MAGHAGRAVVCMKLMHGAVNKFFNNFNFNRNYKSHFNINFIWEGEKRG